MAVDVKAEILIERLREAAAKIMFDPKCDSLWISGLTQSFPQSPGMLANGAKAEPGHYSFAYLLTRSAVNAYVELAADETFQMKLRYDLTDTERGRRRNYVFRALERKSLSGTPGSIRQDRSGLDFGRP